MSIGKSVNAHNEDCRLAARLGLAVGMVALMAAGCASAEGSAFPNRTIEMIVPYPAGSGSDTAARLLTEVMNESGQLDERVQVVNREGGGGTVGATAILNAAPDGHTIGFLPDGPLTLMPHVESELSYDPDAVTVLAGAVSQSIVVAVPGGSPFESFADLIDAAKESPGAVTVGEGPLNYSVPVSMIEDQMDVEFQRVDFDGDGASSTALLGNNVEAAVMQVIGARPHLPGGELRALTLVDNEASDVAPDVPTAADVGLDMDWSAFNVVVAPEGLPEEVEATLSSAFQDVINSEEFQSQAAEQGLEPFETDPAAVEERLAAKYELASDILGG